LERIADRNIGTLEYWKDDKKKETMPLSCRLFKLNIPSFHYSIIPGRLGGVDDHEEFRFLVTEITELVRDS
jgi:hypothetical protein